MLLGTLQQGLSETVRYVAMMHAARLKPNDPGVIANLNAVAECSHLFGAPCNLLHRSVQHAFSSARIPSCIARQRRL